MNFGIRMLGIALSLTAGPIAARADAAPTFKKVMIVIFENTNYRDAIAQPGFADFAHKGANLTQFVAETHPSQGNYVALTSGDLQGVTGDGNIDLDVQHIGDLIESRGKSWKAYLESYPGNCFLGARSGTYARKHNPFASYHDVQTNPQRCARMVDGSALVADIRSGSLPDFSIYIPDMNNDGHDTGVAFASQWFSRTFGPLMQDRHFMQDMLLVATFDESGRDGGNQIYTVLYGDSVKPASTSAARYDHFSLLRTVEDQLGLGNLGRRDVQATPISGIWQ